MKKQTHFDLFSHIIHWLFAIAIIFQLFSSEWMHHKIKPGVEPWMLKLFLFHEIIGVSVFFLLMIYLFRAASLVEKNKLAHLFPYNKKGIITVYEDVKLLLRFNLPDRAFAGLAGMVQGLGFLLALLVASLGVLWLVLPVQYMGASFIHDIKELHEFFADIIWYYLAGHVGMFLLHIIVDKFKRNKNSFR